MSTSTNITITTNYGTIKAVLNNKKAPETVANFVKYAEEGHYNGTIFHRVIPNFMIQGGGFGAGMEKRETFASIVNEADNGLKNEKYSLAMARTNEPHSATSQFFINATNNEFLNHTSASPSGWGYAVFGNVSEGTDVVDQIEAVKTGQNGPHGDVPVADVVIESITVDAQ